MEKIEMGLKVNGFFFELIWVDPLQQIPALGQQEVREAPVGVARSFISKLLFFDYTNSSRERLKATSISVALLLFGGKTALDLALRACVLVTRQHGLSSSYQPTSAADYRGGGRNQNPFM